MAIPLHGGYTSADRAAKNATKICKQAHKGVIKDPTNKDYWF